MNIGFLNLLLVQSCSKYVMVKKWGHLGRNWHRSITLGIIAARGISYLTAYNEIEDEITNEIARNYFILDILYIVTRKVKSLELIIHHSLWLGVSMIGTKYRYILEDRSLFSLCSNLVFISELISVCNVSKNKKFLNIWRLIIVCCFRLPVTLFVFLPAVFRQGMYDNTPRFPVQIFIKCMCVFALGYDVYMLKKIRQAMHRIKR